MKVCRIAVATFLGLNQSSRLADQPTKAKGNAIGAEESTQCLFKNSTISWQGGRHLRQCLAHRTLKLP